LLIFKNPKTWKKKTRRQKKKIPNGKSKKNRGSWTTQPTPETRKEHGSPNRRKSDNPQNVV